MDKEKRLGMLFSSLADELNISETLYERAVTSYTALGDYIKKNNSSWDVEMFPQGSFELGTVIKPINDEDQYDVDLVILVRAPKFEDPHKLRETIQSFLEAHGRYEGKIEKKKQCLRVVYSENSQFHMDVVCATETNYYSDKIINVAKKNEEDDGYNFSPSNPKGYISWFKRAMNYERLLQEAKMQRGKVFNSTKVEELTLSKMRTPLQQAKYFGIYELLIADIVDLCLTNEQEKELHKLKETQENNLVLFATEDSIKACGVEKGTGKQKETITDHTYKILTETTQYLIQEDIPKKDFKVILNKI